MALDLDPYKLSSPRIFLVRMLAFLILAGFAGLILYRQIFKAFMANPGLNGLIIGVLLIGIILAFRQVIRLFREIRWVNSLNGRDPPGPLDDPPVMLAPMATLIGDKPQHRTISTVTLRAILDSIATRLDEGREINRYLTGLLIFLGLLGTFWGLLETVGSISDVIKSMQSGADASVMFDDLKTGLAAPIAGMSISFTSSLFGLAGSLVLGFLDLQAGQAQNRFYTQLEDNLSANAADRGSDFAPRMGVPSEVRTALDRLALGTDQTASRASATAMANLAEGIQGLVQHMRAEQQQVRNWVEAQADQNAEIRKLLQRLASENERR